MERTPTKEPSSARRLRSDNWVLGAVLSVINFNSNHSKCLLNCKIYQIGFLVLAVYPVQY